MLSGSTAPKKMRNSEAPSMRAASSKSSGTPSMSCHIRNTPKEPAANGKMSAG